MEWFLVNNKLVFLFGGFNEDGWCASSTVDCYSPLSDTKKPLRPMNFACWVAAAAALCGDIYIFGGRDGDSWFNTVESYNPQRDEWPPCPSLTLKTACLSGVTLYNKIYAISGGDGDNYFSHVEMFDPAAGKWIPTQAMRQKSSNEGRWTLCNCNSHWRVHLCYFRAERWRYFDRNGGVLQRRSWLVRGCMEEMLLLRSFHVKCGSGNQKFLLIKWWAR